MINLDQRSIVSSSIASERTTETYISDKSERIQKIWQLDQYIFHKQNIKFDYTDYEVKENAELTTIILLPIHTFFDNYYFFLIGFDKESNEYRTFRIDWIENIKKTDVKIQVEYNKRHDHGQEQQYNAYGYMGPKMRIQFEYYGYVGYVKDRFPSCTIIKKLNKKNKFPFSVNLLEIEVNYSAGVKLWLLSQSTILKVVSPDILVEDIKKTLHDSYQLYEN